MKERLTLLGMAYPEESKKYGHTICLAGITDNGEFRRIYPVPYRVWSTIGLKKRGVIEYELRGKGDYRKESMKIFEDSIHVLDEQIDYNTTLRDICNDKATSLECLRSNFNVDKTSLGIVKPTLLGFIMSEKNIENNGSHQILLPGFETPEQLVHKFYYKFKCSPSCNTIHKCSIVDTEAGQLYRNIRKTTTEIEDVRRKMQQTFIDRMITRDVFFMMGTAFLHPKSWMIISVLYPVKKFQQQLNVTYDQKPKPLSIHKSIDNHEQDMSTFNV